MHLATPSALLLLTAIPVLVLASILFRRMRRGAIVPSVGGLGDLPRSTRARLMPILVVLRCCAVALVVVALARPQSGGVPVVDEANAVDVFIVLDVSSSMASEDFPPLNRLEVARRVITTFVDGRPADRVGLVAFARYSVLKCPLTLDHELVKFQLATAQMAAGEDDGTAIGMALASAVRHLRRSPAHSRVVVLLTDGENNRSTIDPSTGAALASAMGIRVYAIGVGRAARDDESTANDDRAPGLNEGALREIADTTGGRYYRADDVDTLARVFRTIDALERSPVPSVSYRSRRELFQWPLGVALLCAGLELLLRHTLLRRLP